MTVFAPTVAALVNLIKASDLDPDPFFEAEGLDPSLTLDANARLPADAIDRIAAKASKASGDPFFGLREAEHQRPGHLGPLGFAWLASPTLRAALNRLSRFARIVGDQIEVTWQEAGEEVIIRIHCGNPSMNEADREDGSLATLLFMCRIIIGDAFAPVRAEFMHEEPEDTRLYFSLFRCPVHFGAEQSVLVVPADIMDTRLSGGNEQIAAMNDHMAVKYLAHRERHDVASRMRAWLIESLSDGLVSEQAAADAMNCSTRQLNRKLKEQNTSFKELANEVRRDLAEQYVKDPTLSLTEISFMLGFSEASSFSRAFKRWTGQSPSEARQLSGP